LAKAILKKVAFQRQLTDGLQHLVVLFLQVIILSLNGLTLRICAKGEMGILQKVLLPFPDHVRMQAILGTDNIGKLQVEFEQL